ncbi:uncharacterized protein LOC116160037 [Photinus pyralis]|nr:uncharacterized protein LOC116160037 [Photinus pyralis]
MSEKLNSDPDGPQLTVADWKKRFTDWKYFVKNKYRKLNEHRLKTGSGPQSSITLTDMEERALCVWGKVTVTGALGVTNFDGILLDSDTMIIPLEEEITEPMPVEDDTPVIVPPEIEPAVTPVPPQKPGTKTLPRQKPLSIVTESLLNTMNKSEKNIEELGSIVKQFSEEYIKCKKEKNKNELLRLKFEVAKYKFENQNFKFDFD